MFQDLDEALVRLMEGAGESIAGAKGNVVSRARAMKEVCIRVGESPLEVEEIRTKGERVSEGVRSKGERVTETPMGHTPYYNETAR